MPGPIIADPTPSWLKPENASVTDSALTRAMRMIGHLIGADNPTSQVLGLMMSEVPSGPTGGIAGALGRLAEKAGFVKAYHGSPHDFERFSMEKIGTGEGAQAYGHGLYFAENPAVAEDYRASLANSTPATRVRVDGTRLIDLHQNNIIASDVGSALEASGLDVDKAIQQVRRSSGSTLTEAKLQQLKGKQITIDPPGHTYEVAIHADPEHFLDWDKPLSQQSEKVQQAVSQQLNQFIDPWTMTGADAYQRLGIAKHQMGRGHMDNAAAAQALKDAGIPGIKYLDQGSRAAGEGSRNYVVFDDSLVEILKKYGIAVPVIEGLRLKAQQQQGVLHRDQLEGLTQ